MTSLTSTHSAAPPQKAAFSYAAPGPFPALWPWVGLGGALFGGAVACGLYLSHEGLAEALAMEGGAIELLQDGLLAAATLVFAGAFYRAVGSRALYCLVATYAATFALVRETPRCGSAFAGDGHCLTETSKLAIMLAASGLAVLALIVRRFRWRKVLRPSNLRWAWPSFIILAIVAAAQIFDKSGMVELEEPLELAAYVYLLWFAVWMLVRARGTERL